MEYFVGGVIIFGFCAIFYSAYITLSGYKE